MGLNADRRALVRAGLVDGPLAFAGMTRAPKFAGVPARVWHGDWLLVDWVATAKLGDPFPDPWCHDHAPLQAMIARLTELGVMTSPVPGTDVATIAREASAAAKLWLEHHPPPEPAPQSVPRRMSWGPPEPPNG